MINANARAGIKPDETLKARVPDDISFPILLDRAIFSREDLRDLVLGALRVPDLAAPRWLVPQI